MKNTTKIFTTVTVVGVGTVMLISPIAAQALNTSPQRFGGSGLHQKLDNLSPEQRSELRKLRKDVIGSLSEDEKAQLRGKLGQKQLHNKGKAANHLGTFLGVDNDTVKQAHEDGKTLVEILEDYDKTIEDFHGYIYQTMQNNLAGRVDSGEITQEQMDLKLKLLTEKLENKMVDHNQKTI